MQQLAKEIESKILLAYKKNEKIAFRLNGTTDIDFIYLLKKYANFNIEDFSNVAVWYDYTKLISKVKRYKDHVNYHLTFSRSENNNSVARSVLSLAW